MKNKLKCVLLLIAAVLAFSGCSQFLTPNKTLLSVSTGPVPRYASGDVTNITIQLSSPAKGIEFSPENTVPGSTTVFNDVEPGIYIITGTAFKDSDPIGEGRQEITVEEGKNNPVNLVIKFNKETTPGTPDTPDTPVTPEPGQTEYTASSFAELKTIIESSINTNTATVTLSGESEWEQSDMITVFGNVTIIADTDVTIKKTSSTKSKSVFCVQAGASLAIGSAESKTITLDGDKSTITATAPLIKSYGELKLNQNSILQNNNNNNSTTEKGGAVYCTVASDDISNTDTKTAFYLNGGIIQNCQSGTRGGGACIEGVLSSDKSTIKKVTVLISSGKITGNTAASGKNGGGLFLTGVAAMITGGEISNNQAGGSSANGGGIYLSSLFNLTGQPQSAANSVLTISKSGSDDLSITGNSNAQYGGGIYVNAGTFNLLYTANNNPIHNNDITTDGKNIAVGPNSSTSGTVYTEENASVLYNKNGSLQTKFENGSSAAIYE